MNQINTTRLPITDTKNSLVMPLNLNERSLSPDLLYAFTKTYKNELYTALVEKTEETELNKLENSHKEEEFFKLVLRNVPKELVDLILGKPKTPNSHLSLASHLPLGSDLAKNIEIIESAFLDVLGVQTIDLNQEEKIALAEAIDKNINRVTKEEKSEVFKIINKLASGMAKKKIYSALLTRDIKLQRLPSLKSKKDGKVHGSWAFSIPTGKDSSSDIKISSSSKLMEKFPFPKPKKRFLEPISPEKACTSYKKPRTL